MRLPSPSTLKHRVRETLDRRDARNSAAPLKLAQMASRPYFRNLWDAEFRVFSQWGEDGILYYLCDVLELWHPRMIEIGAGDYSECNSRFLAQELAGSAVVIDANDDLPTQVLARADSWKSTVVPQSTWVTPDNIARIMNDASATIGALDILSLDIDGNDYWVLDAAPLDGLSILLLEYNPLFGSKLPVTVARDDTFSRYEAHYSSLYYGASLPALIRLASRSGFTFAGTNRVGNNAFFVHQSRVADVPMPLPSPEELSRYVDWTIRDSRSVKGDLDLQTGSKRQDAIAHLPVVQVDTGQVIPLSKAMG